MDMSLTADYFTIAFFAWYGLKSFVPALQGDLSIKLGGVLALLTATTTFLST